MQTPEACIADLEKIPQIQEEQLLSTASELYLSKALALSESYNCQANNDDCLEQELQALDKSIRYSYAYLFKSSRQPQDRIFDNRQVQIRDFYNQALNQLVNAYGEKIPLQQFPPR